MRMGDGMRWTLPAILVDMTEDEARACFAAARVARLATVASDGVPHLVPITFAVVGATIVHAVDHKPKRTRALRRLDHIAVNPAVSVLADHYEEDWRALWWVRADGRARIEEAGSPVGAAAIAALVERYAPYRETPPEGPVVVVAVERWSGWSAS
jgi:PPOX class probable F420-dependent enzyme